MRLGILVNQSPEVSREGSVLNLRASMLQLRVQAAASILMAQKPKGVEVRIGYNKPGFRA
jgi:hypothetical protein